MTYTETHPQKACGSDIIRSSEPAYIVRVELLSEKAHFIPMMVSWTQLHVMWHKTKNRWKGGKERGGGRRAGRVPPPPSGKGAVSGNRGCRCRRLPLGDSTLLHATFCTQIPSLCPPGICILSPQKQPISLWAQFLSLSPVLPGGFPEDGNLKRRAIRWLSFRSFHPWRFHTVRA